MSCQIQPILNYPRPNARVSVILLDWGVRESFHSLYYLNRQTAPRESYELIWLEFYDRRPEKLEQILSAATGAPMLDKWVVMGYPPDVYFHKHLLYNVGIMLAEGQIVVICDSDAMFTPNFITRVIQAFQETPDAVIHLDEVRNHQRHFYPFNYPSVPEVLSAGCSNWNGTTTTGLDGSPDMLHRANYGACMAAWRQDLIEIGGADEHVDYLGYICGPYELTFRLKNAGRQERWLRDEFLFHVWHPGESGANFDYQGPNDGRGMSSRSLDLIENGRIHSYVENPGIKLLRDGEQPSAAELFSLLGEHDTTEWRSIAKAFDPATHVFTVAKDFHGHDLYSRNNRWYAVPTGTVDFDADLAEAGKFPKCLVADTKEALQERVTHPISMQRTSRRVGKKVLPQWFIRWWRRPAPSQDVRLVRPDYMGYNVLRSGSRWFAHRQGCGAFALPAVGAADTPEIVCGKSLTGLKAKVWYRRLRGKVGRLLRSSPAAPASSGPEKLSGPHFSAAQSRNKSTAKNKRRK